jgi:hypothetical protein
MARNQPAPKVFEHKPQSTIKAALAAAAAHVRRANKAK